jgi:hypothetical protein
MNAPRTRRAMSDQQQETAMKPLRKFAVVVGLVLSTTLSAQSNQTGDPGIEALPRDLEMELAASALPAHLQEAATLYVLDPRRGFAIARKGTNGFHALVARTGDDAFRGTWPLTEYPPDVLYPIAFDAAGSSSHMPVFFDIASAQAKGMPAAELKKLIQERFRTGYYKPPARAGLLYVGANHADVRRSGAKPQDQHGQPPARHVFRSEHIWWGHR